MADHSQRFLDNAVELYALKKIFEYLPAYLKAQNHFEHERCYKCVGNEGGILSQLYDLRGEMDALCVDELGMRRYEELGGMSIYSDTLERKPMDPLVSLLSEAEQDPIWRARLNHFAERLDAVVKECIELGGRNRKLLSRAISKLQDDLIPRFKELY